MKQAIIFYKSSYKFQLKVGRGNLLLFDWYIPEIESPRLLEYNGLVEG